MADSATSPARLLLAYDGSAEAATAIGAAGRLFPGARGHVVVVRSQPDALEHAALARIAVPDDVLQAAARAYEREAQDRALELAEGGRQLASEAGLDATADVHGAGSAWRELCRAAEDHAADVLVCGARGQGAFSRAVLGSTSSSLVHHANRPVLVVPSGAGNLDGPALIGYDGSDGARAAITAAGRLLDGRPALVVHVWLSPARPVYAEPTSGEVRQAVIEAPRTDLYALTASLASECADEGAALAQEAGLDASGLPVESAFSAPHALAATAEAEGASVIVVGCRGRGALASTVLGSVSSGLVHNAERPVLIVRDGAA